MDQSAAQKIDWEEAFNAHLKVLESHLKVWQDYQRDLPAHVQDAGHQAATQTQSMIKHFKDLASSAARIADATEDAQPDLQIPDSNGPKRKKKRTRAGRKVELKEGAKPSTPPVISLTDSKDKTATPQPDPSGLFTFDTNAMKPSEVESIINSSNKRSVREWETSQSLGGDKPKHLITQREPNKPKRQKMLHGEDAEKQEQRAKTFEAKVELRLKEQQEQRLKKTDKKRKRESNGSAAASGDQHDVSLIGVQPSSRKRRKNQDRNHQTDNATNDQSSGKDTSVKRPSPTVNEEAFTNSRKNGAGTPEGKRQKRAKRAS